MENEELEKALSQSSIFTIRNDLFFYDDIDEKSSVEFTKAIYDLYLTIVQNCINTGLRMPPINIHIKSDGGIISDGLQIIKTIKTIQKGLEPFFIPCEVNTYIEGVASSCASLIACVGNFRFSSKYATSIIHDVSFTYNLKDCNIKDMEDFESNSKLLKETIKRVYLEHTKISEKELDEVLKSDKAYNAEWLLEHGFIDAISN